MKVLAAVVSDLFVFAFKYWFGFRSLSRSSHQVSAANEATTKEVAPPQALAKETETKEILSDGLSLVEAIGHPLSLTEVENPSGILVYVRLVEVPLFILPTRTFDGVLMKLKFGSPVDVLGRQGQWLQVLVGETRGWVHNDDVTDSLASLRPRFEAGKIYDANHLNTATIRILIGDMFFAAQLDLPLQDVEFVTYQLQQKNRFINWPKVRPRVAGTWHRILKGNNGIHLGISPKADAVMEYTNNDNTGHVAYVDSVFPDGSIGLSEVGYPTEGMFTRRSLSQDEWKELRPVFIEVA